jgi:hypothetical protein
MRTVYIEACFDRVDGIELALSVSGEVYTAVKQKKPGRLLRKESV